MTHSIIIRLNKPTREFRGGENIGFNIRAGVQYYDRQAKEKEWTSHSTVVFAKLGAQADYYRSVLVEGGIVETTGENIGVNVYQGQSGQSTTPESLNAKTGFATSGDSQRRQSSNHQNNPEYDDSIPFRFRKIRI